MVKLSFRNFNTEQFVTDPPVRRRTGDSIMRAKHAVAR